MSPAERGKPHAKNGQHGIPPAEWAVALLGAALTLGAIGYLTAAAFSGRDRPPDIVIDTLATDSVSAGWLVRIRATNRGDRVATEVEVEGTSGEETSGVTFDYLPAGSSREGGLFFRTKPGEVELRALGYRGP